jgi:hypothetical protein
MTLNTKTMEQFQLEKDLTVFYIQALSFPDGVLAAHQQLHAAVARTKDRRFFGLSRPEGKSGIVYRAAAEELLHGEGARLGYDSLVIPNGNYSCITIPDFRKDIAAIGKVFQELTHLPGVDPNGYCVEWYLGENDVKCMIRMK